MADLFFLIEMIYSEERTLVKVHYSECSAF